MENIATKSRVNQRSLLSDLVIWCITTVTSASRHLGGRRCDPMAKDRAKLVLFQPSKVEKALAKRQVKEISR